MPDEIKNFVRTRHAVPDKVETDDSFLTSDGTMSFLGLLNSLIGLGDQRISIQLDEDGKYQKFVKITSKSTES